MLHPPRSPQAMQSLYEYLNSINFALAVLYLLFAATVIATILRLWAPPAPTHWVVWGVFSIACIVLLTTS